VSTVGVGVGRTLGPSVESRASRKQWLSTSRGQDPDIVPGRAQSAAPPNWPPSLHLYESGTPPLLAATNCPGEASCRYFFPPFVHRELGVRVRVRATLVFLLKRGIFYFVAKSCPHRAFIWGGGHICDNTGDIGGPRGPAGCGSTGGPRAPPTGCRRPRTPPSGPRAPPARSRRVGTPGGGGTPAGNGGMSMTPKFTQPHTVGGERRVRVYG